MDVAFSCTWFTSVRPRYSRLSNASDCVGTVGGTRVYRSCYNIMDGTGGSQSREQPPVLNTFEEKAQGCVSGRCCHSGNNGEISTWHLQLLPFFFGGGGGRSYHSA